MRRVGARQRTSYPWFGLLTTAIILLGYIALRVAFGGAP